MADIQYLNYGDQQIEQQAFLTKAANEVQGYVQKQPWSKKRKEKFMSAYSDLMNRGIQGASNGSGQWMIDVGGEALPFDSMSQKDKEMYQEAAYFIQQQMAGLPTKVSQEEAKEDEKKDLPLFDNKYFTEGLHSYIGNQMFGGRDWSTSEDWNPLDERGENGIRGHQNRALKLAEMLEGYSNSLDETKLNFENSPFKDLNDFKSRLNNAITALRTKTPDDDKDALNQIGLRSSDYFNNGGDDQFTKGDFTGTYNQYYNEYLPQQQKAKQDAVLAQQKAIRANQYDRYTFYNFLNGTPGNEQDFLNISQKLAGQQKLDGNELSRISWAFRQGMKNGGLQNLSKEELAKFGSRYAPNRLKKLPELEGIYYDSVANRLIQPFKGQQQTGATLSSILAENSPEALEKKKNEQKNQALQHKWGEGLTDDMKADLTALGLDAVSAGAAFAPGFGTATSAITGIGATLAGAYADRKRGESWASTLGTAGFGLTMDILGLVPGLGVAGKAAKMAKIVSKGAKWIGPVLGGMAALSYGPGAISAFNKFTSGKVNDITAEELRDFTYAMRAVAVGGIRKAGSTYQGNRTLKKAIAGRETVGTTAKGPRASISTEKTSASITTKNGQQIELTDGEFKTLSGNGSRQSKIDLLKSKGIKEEDIDWKGINPVKGRFKTSSKSSQISGLQKGSESGKVKWNSTSADYKGIRRFSNENLLRNYMQMSGPNTGVWKWMRDRWNGDDIIPSSTKTTNTNILKQQLALPNKNPLVRNSPMDRTPINVESNLNIKQEIEIPKNYKNVDLKSREIIESFQHSYNLGGLKSTPMQKGFGGNAVKAGEYDNKLLKITLSRNEAKELRTNPGKLATFRGQNAKKIQEIIKQKKATDKEISDMIKDLKKKGFLKQGGTIDRQRIQNYKEFINK